MQLEELPDSILQHVLAFIPAVSLARAAQVCTAFRRHVHEATDIRVVLLGRTRLPPPMRPKDNRLQRLLFCETVASRPPRRKVPNNITPGPVSLD